jgi:hypothetical protein
MADVEAAGGRRRRAIDREDVLAGGLCTIESVGALVFPDRSPFCFETLENWLLRYGGSDGELRFDICGTESEMEVPECEVVPQL